jgi:hypothetical protein
MGKENTMTTIDTDLKAKVKAKGGIISSILNDALIKWLDDNETIKEREAKAVIASASVSDVRLEREANTPEVMTALVSKYAMKLRVEKLKEQGFTEEEISKIFDIARQIKGADLIDLEGKHIISNDEVTKLKPE